MRPYLCISERWANILFASSTLHLMLPRMRVWEDSFRWCPLAVHGSTMYHNSFGRWKSGIRDKWDKDEEKKLHSSLHGVLRICNEGVNLWSIVGFAINKHIH